MGDMNVLFNVGGGEPYNSREPGLVIKLEARGGIEPPNKDLQTLSFSFWVPRQM